MLLQRDGDFMETGQVCELLAHMKVSRGPQGRLAPLKAGKACVSFETYKERNEKETQVVPRGKMFGYA